MATPPMRQRDLRRGALTMVGARLVQAILVVVITGALTGCGASPQDEVQAKVEQFAHAVAGRDYRALCQQILAPSLVAHLVAAGLSCHQAMRVFLQSVANPTLSIARITVKGDRASAVVLTAAAGQHAALTSIQLIDTSRGWRLVSLAPPG